MKAIIDNWTKNKNSIKEHNLTKREDVICLVDILDGQKHTELIFDGDNGSALIIGGGEDRSKYVINYTVNIDEKIYILTNSDPVHESAVKLKTGGQVGIFSAKNIVAKSLAQDVALFFFETGLMNPKYFWEIH